ncbi:hypothetical protein, partial [Buttiauxella gaviniae]|uniref:hypothetical protein n=1 Tax=Buttiauxella gaviniae TaxID=82990 RepID=UPI003BB60692
MLATLAALIAMFGGLAFAASPALAFETHLFETSFGPDGTSATRFERPSSLAVDQSTGSIYVGDAVSNTVQRFDLANAPEPFLGISPNVVEGKLTGFEEQHPNPDQVAVSSATHDVYLGVGESLAAFQPDGEPADFTAGPGVGTNEIAGSEICGVAVESGGDIYVSERMTGVRVFAPSGAALASFAASPVCDLAVDSNGTVYANGADEPGFSEDFGPVQKFTPSVFPVTLSTTYEPDGVVDGSQSLGVAVDPSNNHLFVDEGDQIAEFNAAGKELGSFGNSGPGTLSINTGRQGVGVAVNGATGQVYVAQGRVVQGEEGLVEVFGPAIQLPDVSTVKASAIEPTGAATLNGVVQPEGIALSECEFEYVIAAHYEAGASDPYAAGATAQCTPAAEAIPTGGETPVHADVTGLASGVTYLYRLRASNKTALNDNPPNFGADETFNTPPRPAISGENTSNLIQASVDLNAQVNPEGLEVEQCDFEY